MSLQTVANDDKLDGAEESTTFQEAQKQSRDVQLVRKWIEKGSRSVFSGISQHGYTIKSLWNQFERLAIKDGLLMRRWVLLPSSREVYQAIIPDSERRRVLEMCHDNKTSAHLGVTKTLEKIRQRYYWPGLQRDVHQEVAGCEIFTKRKNPIPKGRVAQSGASMERMAYRSTVHETIGFSQNIFMFGREATTPLDLMYEMLPEIKSIPANQWVWALRERLEKSHAIVRENVQGEMLRQKKYHDAQTSWSSFEPGEMAYVYFL
jgi:hypothetical protein